MKGGHHWPAPSILIENLVRVAWYSSRRLQLFELHTSANLPFDRKKIAHRAASHAILQDAAVAVCKCSITFYLRAVRARGRG